MTLWTSEAIAHATNGRSASHFDVTGISIDSRSVQPGDLFVALKGPRNNGHDWVVQALRAGASGALVHHPISGCDAGRLIAVADTFQALCRLGYAARDRYAGQLVGITGSVGKTSTKDMLAHVLSGEGGIHAAVGSLNNHWGVPVTLARMSAEGRCAIIEMGMNHANELRDLSTMARPHVVAITWVAAAHLEFFADVSQIAEAKAEIFDGVSPQGSAVLPVDNSHYSLLRARAQERCLNVVTFGYAREADFCLRNVTVTPQGTHVQATCMGNDLRYSLRCVGEHWARNSLAVLASVYALDLDVRVAAERLLSLVPSIGRGRVCTLILPSERGHITLIDESYNANPTSMQAALASLAVAVPRAGGRRIAVLGDMLELGQTAPDLHRALAYDVVKHGIEHVYTVGSLMQNLNEALPKTVCGVHAADSEAVSSVLLDDLCDGDVLMIKGSAGSGMKKILSFLETCVDQSKQAV